MLEFLHRLADALEEFIGSPLLASKIAVNYDVVAQIVAEVADAGLVCQGEANALRDVVETGPGVLKNLLEGVGLQTPSGGAAGAGVGPSPTGISSLHASQVQSNQGSAIPWRRSNVRHTNNELKVDIVETLQVTLAPSGRPLSAFVHGSIAFTAQVSGVPDLLLTLSTGGKHSSGNGGDRASRLQNVLERTVFHPCVRLNRWKSEGVLSFVPPDGRFVLGGYEVDLLSSSAEGAEALTPTSAAAAVSALAGVGLPVRIEMTTGLGPSGAEFEVRATPILSSTGSSSSNGLSSSSTATNRPTATASLQSNLRPARPGSTFRSGSDSNSNGANKSSALAALEFLTINIPVPPSVRNVSDLRPSRGEAHWNPADTSVEWRISPKELTGAAVVLRCTLQGPLSHEDVESSQDLVRTGGNGFSATTYDYDEGSNEGSVARESGTLAKAASQPQNSHRRNKALMPTTATMSFSIKGWLASGLKVEGLVLDVKKSRELGAQVKPYKGVKYLTVSRKGVEVRC